MKAPQNLGNSNALIPFKPEHELSSGYFILEWKLNFSGSWKILRIQLKIQGKFHFLESVQTFDILYIFWGLRVGWHRTSEVYPWFGPPLWPFIWTL